jgi:hypothetical protein
MYKVLCILLREKQNIIIIANTVLQRAVFIRCRPQQMTKECPSHHIPIQVPSAEATPNLSCFSLDTNFKYSPKPASLVYTNKEICIFLNVMWPYLESTSNRKSYFVNYILRFPQIMLVMYSYNHSELVSSWKLYSLEKSHPWSSTRRKGPPCDNLLLPPFN